MKKFELVNTSDTIPIKIFMHSINKSDMHWHKEIEILLVLEGSIKVRIGKDQYTLQENDLILLNPNEVHSTMKTDEENTLLALQMQTELFNKYYPGFNEFRFECKSFLHEDQERFNEIRHLLARFVWEINKKVPGYEFNIISIISKLGYNLINKFPKEQLEGDTSESVSRDIFRLNSIIEYIKKNLSSKITLKDVAGNEGLSKYYLSHYIKRMLGVSFQEYINLQRLNKSIDLLLSTDKTVTEIAIESGFASIKALNTVMKRNNGCTSTEYREKNIEEIFKYQQMEGEEAKIKSKTYLDVDREKHLSKLWIYIGKRKNQIELNKNKL